MELCDSSVDPEKEYTKALFMDFKQRRLRMEDPKEWAEDAPQISVKDMTEFVADMRLKREAYEAMKKQSNDLYEKYKQAEATLLNALQATGMQKFNVPGIGTASLRKSYKVKIPKDVPGKRALFEYITGAYGNDVLDEYRTINHQTLNAFYNQECQIAEEKGKEFKLPGVEDPVVEFGIQWRKDRDS